MVWVGGGSGFRPGTSIDGLLIGMPSGVPYQRHHHNKRQPGGENPTDHRRNDHERPNKHRYNVICCTFMRIRVWVESE